ncbi:MAG: SIMPL domain-containing protein [Candidatus Paceibacteria bacterium]
MDQTLKKIITAFSVPLILSVILLMLAGVKSLSEPKFELGKTPTVMVSGEGKEIAIPDVAVLSFGVLTEGEKNLSALQKENTEKINKIISFLKDNAVAEKDIKTQFYNITPRYQYFYCPPPEKAEVTRCPPPEIVGYTINQSVLVKIRDLSRVGDILTGVVENGANTISGPTFTVDDPTELQNKARQKAIDQAKAKAKTMAGAAGFRLGKIVSIQEGVTLPTPIPLAVYGKGGGEFGGPAIEPGSQEIVVNVSITYAIR